MPVPGDFDAFVPNGLATLGIEADEVELAVMQVTHELYWPPIAALYEIDFSGVEPEAVADMSQPPQ
jgi:hypothetical protein